MAVTKVTVTGDGETMKAAWDKVNDFIDDYEAGTNAASHASKHTDGTDDIQNATAAQKGLATAAQITKLDAIEALANVTDAINVGSSIHGVANKATPIDADKVPSIDTEGSNTLKTSPWTHFQAFLKAYFAGLYGDVTAAANIDANAIVVGDDGAKGVKKHASAAVSAAGTLSGVNQFAFPATAVPSADPNTLDDYEEGELTPVTISGSSGGSYGVRAGNNVLDYRKIGDIVHVQGLIIITSDNSFLGHLPILMPFTAIR